MPKLSKRAIELLIVGILLVYSSALILFNLGNIFLWGDEAQTALLAKTVLKYGYPRGFDGTNYFSLLSGAEYGPNYIWKWHPWFPFYLLAGFFAVLGTSTFVARLPFALFGIATVILTYYFGKSLWGIRRVGALAAILLMASVPFLLLVRQCRYYAPTAFFSLAGLYAYTQVLENRKRAPVFFVLSAVLLFHTQFVNCAALLATVFAHAVIYRRDKLKLVILLSAITAAVSLPWIIWFSSLGNVLQGNEGYAARSIESAKYYVFQIGKHIIHPALVIIPAAAYIIHRIRRTSGLTMLETARGNLVLLLLYSGISVVSIILASQWGTFRQLTPIIPVACLVMALMIESGMRIHPAVGLVTIGLLAWWWRMPDYLYEITHDYDGPNEGIVQYLKLNASDSDLVVANQEDLVLKFYTKMRVIGISTGEDLTPARDADWLVIRRWTSGDSVKAMLYLRMNIPWDQYEPITLPYPDIRFENREDPEEHKFHTVDTFDLVTIFRRIAE